MLGFGFNSIQLRFHGHGPILVGWLQRSAVIGSFDQCQYIIQDNANLATLLLVRTLLQ